MFQTTKNCINVSCLCYDSFPVPFIFFSFSTRTQANFVSKADCLMAKSHSFMGLQCDLYLTLLASGNEFGAGAVCIMSEWYVSARP